MIKHEKWMENIKNLNETNNNSLLDLVNEQIVSYEREKESRKMTVEQYNELVNELNFYDSSVGINQITLKEHEVIKSILEEFNYIPIGLYETVNSEGYKFKGNDTIYAVQERKGKLDVIELIEL